MKERMKKWMAPLLALSLLCNIGLLGSQGAATQQEEALAAYSQKIQQYEESQESSQQRIQSLSADLAGKEDELAKLKNQVRELEEENASLKTAPAAPASSSSGTAPAAAPSAPVQTPKVTQYVWVTATGSKYHARSNCGNSKTARQIPLDSARAQGYTACKNCY